jgi:DNA-binding beta-propeller fold protein YncE
VLVDLDQKPPSIDVLEGDSPSSAMFTADGRTVVTLSDDGHVRYVDVETKVVKRTLDFGAAGSGRADWPLNRRFMVAADADAAAVVAWDVETGDEVYSAREPDVTDASISSDGSALALGHVDGHIELVDLDAGGERKPVPASLDDELADIAWSPDGKRFAGATQQHTVMVWDARTIQVEAVLRGHSGPVTDVAFSPDGTTIYASGHDGSIFAWDLSGTTGIVRGSEWRPLPGATSAAMAPDGSIVATRYADGRVEVFDAATRKTFDEVVPGDVDWISVDRLGPIRTGLHPIGPSAWVLEHCDHQCHRRSAPSVAAAHVRRRGAERT